MSATTDPWPLRSKKNDIVRECDKQKKCAWSFFLDIPQIEHFLKEPLHSASTTRVDNALCIRPLSAIVRREIFGINQLEKSIFRRLSTGDDFNLGRGACIKPSSNDLPRDREESRCVDNDHFCHGLRKAKRINKGLFLDNRQSAASQLRRRQVLQVQDAKAFEAR